MNLITEYLHEIAEHRAAPFVSKGPALGRGVFVAVVSIAKGAVVLAGVDWCACRRGCIGLLNLLLRRWLGLRQAEQCTQLVGVDFDTCPTHPEAEILLAGHRVFITVPLLLERISAVECKCRWDGLSSDPIENERRLLRELHAINRM